MLRQSLRSFLVPLTAVLLAPFALAGQFQVPITLPTGKHPSQVAVGNFNNLGGLDFAVTNTDDDTVSVYLGNGNSFFLKGTFSPGHRPVGIATGFISPITKADLVVANSLDDQVAILKGDGRGRPGSSQPSRRI